MRTSSPDRSRGSVYPLLAFLLFACILGACEPPRVDYRNGIPRDSWSRSDTRPAPDDSPDVVTPLPEPQAGDVLVCGVVYPEGYDWLRDTSLGDTDARIVVFRNGKEALRLPVGGDIQASPDGHCLLEGHLYTAGQADGQTVIRRDGAVLFSSEGVEQLRGLLIRDGDLFTLGQRSGRKGFVLRRNGEEVLSRSRGQVKGLLQERAYAPEGALYLDEGQVVFCFQDESGWYIARDGEISEAQVGDADTVMDLRSVDGVLYAVGFPKGGSTICLYRDGQKTPRALFPLVPQSDFRIYRTDGDILALGSILWPGDIRKLSLWLHFGHREQDDLDVPGVVPFHTGPQKAFIYQTDEGWMARCPKGGDMTLGEGRLYSTRSGAFMDGSLYLGLSFKDGRPPVLWKDGQVTEMGFNGYLTGIEAF